MEVSALDTDREALESLWTGYAEMLTNNGILTHSGVRIISKCPIVGCKPGEYFKP